MQTPKGRSGSSEATRKVSPRTVQQLKTTGLETDSSSSSNQTRTPKERSPKVVERRSPRSPVPEPQKKRPSRISELESQTSQLEEELKRVKDQLSSSESSKKQALEDAEESKKQLLDMSSKLEESQKQLLELSASEEVRVIELQKISQDQDRAWQSELEAVQQQNSVDSAALASAMNEIQRLKIQLEMVAKSENKHTESADVEIETLKANLTDTLSLVETMKTQLRDSKESEAKAQALASETLLQLQTAKKSVEALRSDGMNAIEAYNSIASELDRSKARANLLEELVGKLEVDLHNASSKPSQESPHIGDNEHAIGASQNSLETNQVEDELCSLKSQVGWLRSALEAAEIKHHEEQIHGTVQIRSAYELVEQLKSGSAQREAELEAELKQAKSDIEELKADLMDKETELQGISEENEGLNLKLKNGLSSERTPELENELKKLKENVANMKASLMDKETELQNILEENEMLKVEISKRDYRSKVNDKVVVELEAARAAEREALVKLGIVMEEAEKSNSRVARVTEQLEAAQSANSEMEAELRRLKVQSDQWRKAAEAAAAMLSGGNNGKFMDTNYNPVAGKIGSPYNEDMDDDLIKKKNGNVLKKIGVLWKKPHK